MKTNRILRIVFLFLISVWKSYGQGATVYGTVRDTSGNPLDQAWVMIAETKQGVLTDMHGTWKMENVQEGSWTLLAIYVGYEKRIKKIQVISTGENRMDFILPPLLHMLEEVKISGIRVVHGMGQLEEVHDGIIYSGKKTEVLLLDSMDANTAQNNPRQVLGRIPGANFSETEGSGFPSNGIGFRGLNPAQSVELDTRQNGYNIAGDIYGYPESYYLPPLEAIERIEVIRGASSLQYGPQFGGVINYIVKDPPLNKPFVYTTEQTVGSYGLFNSFNGFGGTIKKWSYYGFLEYAYANGWRPNSQLQQMTGFASVEYKAGNRFKVGMEYSALRNMLHMPGGLDDVSFNQDPGQSLRSRNWLTTPWNVLALTAKYNVNDKVELTFKSALNLSQRNIVWRNEDGGPQAPDSISRITNSYAPREVEHEGFNSSTSELRMLTTYSIHGVSQTLAAGIRFFDGFMNREEGGPGSTGSDFDMGLYGGTYSNNLNFLTLNVAPFVENIFHIGNRLSFTPGFRYEYIRSSATGYVTTDADSVLKVNETKTRSIPLAGAGIQFKTSNTTNVYGNISQAYRPIAYSFLYPLGLDVNAKIDPNLKDITGYNADAGWRGSIKNYLTFDIGGFYMIKNNAIAIETLKDSSTFETNVANAVYMGAETYVELNITKLFSQQSGIGAISVFNSFAYDHARYVNGLYKGNVAEFAPATIERAGITYAITKFSTTFLFSRTAQSFSDANNTVFSTNAETGIIPAWHVMDWSASWRIKRYKIKFGINNLADAHYFTMRTNEYPGPGIIPGMGRSFYLGFGASF